jgi:hypothetical protein
VALTASIDETVTPPTLTVVSDRRKVSVTAVGETVVATFPVHVTDASRTWVAVSDDGTTAVFHG